MLTRATSFQAAIEMVLPRESFVPFSARKAKTPSLIWKNPALDGLSIEKHAYFIPLSDDNADCCLQVNKVFLGERYGGEGLGSNGGGVRCGVEGASQIKGIGKNPLAGKRTDFDHSYGGASLVEGIREAIWGEVCDLALPYGGIRTLGLIGTGTRVPVGNPTAGCMKTTPRALVVRQSALRPAHYMRAIFFVPEVALPDAPSDTTRTRAAILSIGRGFASAFGWDAKRPLDSNAINEGLVEMTQRFARQLACARAKRIMHGSLTASNISMDGAWLDYGTISTVSDYGRIITQTSAPDFLHEEGMLQGSLRNLIFYLRKYLPIAVGSKVMEADALWSHFRNTLASRLQIEFCKLTGVPESQLSAIAPSILKDLYRVMCTIMAIGNGVAFPIPSAAPSHEPYMPEKMGRFHLNSILRSVSVCVTQAEAEAALQIHLADAELRNKFVCAYWRIRGAYYEKFCSKSQHDARTFLAINAFRLNAEFSELYRTNLDPAIESLVSERGDVSAFIAKVLGKARTMLPDADECGVRLDSWFGGAARLTEHSGISVNCLPKSLDDVLAAMPEAVLGQADRIRLRQACGETR